MLRRSAASLVVLMVVAGFVFAATREGTVKRVDKDKNEIVVTGKEEK
jgi:hypothetical protein